MAEEYLDVVDEKDNVIRKELRNNVYKKGPNNQLSKDESIRVINILIFNSNNELLLQKRSMNRRLFPGEYDLSCAEHVSSGEDYEEAAYRGLKEELGMDINLEELGKLTPKEGVHCFMKIYRGFYDKDIIEYDKDGIDKLVWVPIKEVLDFVEKDGFKWDPPIIIKWYITNFLD